MLRRVVLLTTSVLGVALAAVGVAVTSADAPADDSVVASFDGGTIRLAEGWGEAQACVA